MMNLADLAAWTLAASVLVTDPHGHRFVRGISRDGAAAIAVGCLVLPLFKGDDGTHCASLLVTMSADESGNNLRAAGDCEDHLWVEGDAEYRKHHPRFYLPDPKTGQCREGDRFTAFGPFQSHTVAVPFTSWTAAVSNYMPILHASMKQCPDYPLAALAGSCASARARAISDERLSEAKRVWLAMQPQPTAEK